MNAVFVFLQFDLFVCVCVLPPYLAGIYNRERKSPETSRLLGFIFFVCLRE